mgnify:CR=1 FL=1
MLLEAIFIFCLLCAIWVGIVFFIFQFPVPAGLVEALAAPPYDGKADLPDIAYEQELEVDESLPGEKRRDPFPEVARVLVLVEGALAPDVHVAGQQQQEEAAADHLMVIVPTATPSPRPVSLSTMSRSCCFAVAKPAMKIFSGK